jgi:hypothetical protein
VRGDGGGSRDVEFLEERGDFGDGEGGREDGFLEGAYEAAPKTLSVN